MIQHHDLSVSAFNDDPALGRNNHYDFDGILELMAKVCALPPSDNSAMENPGSEASTLETGPSAQG